MKIPLPPTKYVKKIEVNDTSLEIEFASRKKIALVFVCLNDRYWPYLTQVIKDCRQNFLPQHHVDYFAWTDYSEKEKQKQLTTLDQLIEVFTKDPSQDNFTNFLSVFTNIIRLYEHFYPQQLQQLIQELANQGLFFKRDGAKFWVESARQLNAADCMLFYQAAKNILLLSHTDMEATLKGVNLIETEPVEWPAPTLMRYHLFLGQEEKLKEYDYIFYMDADMRVVSRISDEILGEDLTVALHPMYDFNSSLIPPYEPNEHSQAFIPRLGHIVDAEKWEKGEIVPGRAQELMAAGRRPRYRPLYLAGGLQGGTSKAFLKAMKEIKQGIDKDFDSLNYIAIWNDESHWNKYIYKTRGPILDPKIIVLGAEYVYPDSLIKEYYEPRWGRKLEPKIITLTKPFTISPQAVSEINKIMKV